MRITFVLPPVNLSGGIRVIAIYADRLRRRGHEVVAVSPPPRQPRLRSKMRSWLRGRGWPVAPATGPSHLDGLDIEHRILDRWRPVADRDVPDADVVVATWWETAEWVAALSPSRGAKAYFLQHHEVHTGPPERVNATWSFPMHKIVISDWLADLARVRFDDHDVSLVYNSVDTRQFHAPPRGKQGRPTVGMLYHDHPTKACEVGFAAYRKASLALDDIQLVAFGTEHPSPALPLPPGTLYWRRPEQEALKSLYARCDVWLCSSRSEGFHLPPLEAMACRCPVVATRVGGTTEIIEEGVNGHLVDVGDLDGLADRLLRILGRPDAEWRSMSEAAYRTATRYTWDDATDRFEAALGAAIDKSRRP
jgi:glycosyltransferase involved in cell wall biosynthesis